MAVDQGVGLHIKQSGPFDVDGNTNTDLSRVVTAYLSPLVIHMVPVECVCLQRLTGCIEQSYCSSRGGSETEALACNCRGSARKRPSGFLFLRFDIDLLAVHKKIRRHQLPVGQSS